MQNFRIKIIITIYSVCVLTGLPTEQYDQIMRWWSSKPQSGIATVLDSDAYCYVILPYRSCYSIPRHSYHTSSSSHPGITRIHPRISAYRIMSFVHPGVSRLCPIILTSYSAIPPPSRSYCVILSPNHILLLASHENPAKVSQICFSITSWNHQAYLLFPPPY